MQILLCDVQSVSLSSRLSNCVLAKYTESGAFSANELKPQVGPQIAWSTPINFKKFDQYPIRVKLILIFGGEDTTLITSNG